MSTWRDNFAAPATVEDPGRPGERKGYVEGRAAWYSFAYFLRQAAGQRLDVDPQELQAGVRTTEDGRAEAFLYDALENGAGYCRFLCQSGELDALLTQSVPTLATASRGTIASRWLSAAHGSCDASCNRCLRDFANQSVHPLLDWRLALDMARLAADPDTIVDLASDWTDDVGRPIPNPWRPLIEGSQAPIARSLTALGWTDIGEIGGLRAFRKDSRLLLLRHPLWTDAHKEYLDATARAQKEYPNTLIATANPFRALRRPIDFL